MQNSENRIDSLFRNKLNDHEVVPPPAVWDNIEDSLDGKNHKKRMIWIFSLSIAASLLFAFIAGWYFSEQISHHDIIQAENNSINSVTPAQSGKEQLTSANTINSHTKTGSSTAGYNYIATGKTSNTVFLTNSERTDDIEITRENFIIQLLSPLKTQVNSNQKYDYELIAMNDNTEFSDADRAIIALNIQSHEQNGNENNKSNSRFALGVQASPVYRFNNASSQSLDYVNLLGSSGSQEYKTNVSGGIAITYKTDKKLSFQSGVYYDEITQDGGEIGVTYTSQNWISDKYTDSNYLASASTSNTGEATNTVILNTNMGLANLTLPVGTEVASVNSTEAIENEETANYDFRQRAGYIEIPMILRYRIIGHRLGLHLLGGLNTNVLIVNEASLINNNNVIANGKTEGLNEFTFSSSLGLGMSYAINNRFNLSIEPTMKFLLNSLNNQDYYNSRPYTVGIFTGITYQF